MAVQTLAANGAKVYAAGRRLEVLQQSAKVHANEHSQVPGEIIPLEMDETDKDSIQKAFEFIKSKESKLDLLINNAGLPGTRANVSSSEQGAEEFSKQLFSLPMSDWDSIYKTNVFGYYYVSAAFLPLLVAANKEDSLHKNKKSEFEQERNERQSSSC